MAAVTILKDSASNVKGVLFYFILLLLSYSKPQYIEDMVSKQNPWLQPTGYL